MTQRLRILHSVLGGDLFGNTLLCPTIGHGSRDRGTAYTEAPGAPNGLLARVYNGIGLADDLAAKDRALEILGERSFADRRRAERIDLDAERQRREARCRAETAQWAEIQRRQRLALGTWDASRDPRGTPVEAYLNGRALDLTDDLAGTVLRWLPAGPWGRGTAPMMIALMRNILTGEPQAIQRTALSADGRKIDRWMLGPAGGAAIMLDPPEDVASGIVIGEGAETAMSARQFGLRPCWAVGSAGAIAAFPVLAGVGSLTVLGEIDGGANAKAARDVGRRWLAEGRTADLIMPTVGRDLNDTLVEVARACP